MGRVCGDEKKLGGAAAAAVVLVVVLLGAAAVGVEAQTICGVTGAGLFACRPSATPPNPSPPSSACCSALRGADIPCLCRYRNSPILPSLGIDPNLAMQLPAKCKLPNAKHC